MAAAATESVTAAVRSYGGGSVPLSWHAGPKAHTLRMAAQTLHDELGNLIRILSIRAEQAAAKQRPPTDTGTTS